MPTIPKNPDNKCEVLGFEHAWEKKHDYYPEDTNTRWEFKNCGLKKYRKEEIVITTTYSDKFDRTPILDDVTVIDATYDGGIAIIGATGSTTVSK